MTAKFSLGDKVLHPGGTDANGDTFQAGVGAVSKVVPDPAGFKYRVKCDETKIVIPFAFPEADLTAA